MSEDLIETAHLLARANLKRARQADLRRAISTAYYAAFHFLARQCADLLVGSGGARSDGAWSQVYRALDHGFVRNACKQAAGLGFPPAMVDFANALVRLQEERHRADYDPDARYTRAEAQNFISVTEQALTSFRKAVRRDRRAFAVLVLLRRR